MNNWSQETLTAVVSNYADHFQRATKEAELRPLKIRFPHSDKMASLISEELNKRGLDTVFEGEAVILK